jgi:glycosyltransferase involved in cell wall biosynthesis
VTAPLPVSFVVPVRDGARYLGECLASIRAQTVAPLEVLVIDDGSSDDSAEVARSFGGAVRCLRQPHGGTSTARNRAIAEARGDLIAFLDADDLIVPQKLERQLACFAADPTLQFCDAYTRNVWSPEIPVAERVIDPRESFTHGDGPKPGLIITWLCRRELFDRLGSFEPTLALGEDAEWRDRVDAADVRCETVDEVLALRRLHADNVTRRRYDDYLRHVVRRSRDRMRRARSGRAEG